MFHTIFYVPLYNALVFLSSIIPGGDVGLAIITLTIIVKVVLFPLFQKATATQILMKKVEPEIAQIRETYKDDQQTQTKKILELYRTNKINPFVSFFAILIQLPIVIALFWVFQAGFNFDPTSPDLYSFVTVPAVLSTKLFGLFNILDKSWILALLTGITQYIQTSLALPKVPAKKKDAKPDFKEDFARSMNMNMRYFMPFFITFIAYSLSSAISIYWITSNVFSIGQEYYLRKIKKY